MSKQYFLLTLIIASIFFSANLNSLVLAQSIVLDELSLDQNKLLCMTPILNSKYFSSNSATNEYSNFNFYALGGGSISIRFDASFPENRRGYIEELFNIVYPKIIEVYGSPSQTVTVTIKFDPTQRPWNYYDPINNLMVLSDLPPSQGINPALDNIFTHELIHVFHDAIYLIPEASWAEEGMTECTTEIVAKKLKDEGIRDIVYRDMIINLKYYDVWSYAGPDFLGGTQYFFYKTDPDLSYRSSAAMFIILANELSTDLSKPYGFLERLNAEIYNRGETYINDYKFKSIVRSVAGSMLVEEMYADEWLGSQPITSLTRPSGSYLAIFPIKPENPSQVRVYAFERSVGPYGKYENPIPNAFVDVKIYDHTGGTVDEFSVYTNDYGIGEYPISPHPMPTGGYEIYASATIEGSSVDSKSYGFSKGEDYTITSSDENIYGVTLDIGGKPVYSSINANRGTLQTVENGAFVLKADNTNVPFEVKLKAGGYEKAIGKPNPYTRVVWTYATPAESYSITTNILGLPSDYETNLYVDSEFLKTLRGGDSETIDFDTGTSHTISVNRYVNVSSDSRYNCQTNIFTVSSGGTIDFTYHAEHLITFDHSIPDDSVAIQVDAAKGEETKNYSLPANFWWEEGSTHEFIYPETVNALEGKRYVLNYTSVSSPITVSSPENIVGYYYVQYYLTVNTELLGVANILGEDWYNKGENVSLLAPDVEAYNFMTWKIDSSEISGNPVSVIMDSPHTATAAYESTGLYDITITAYGIRTGSEIGATFTFDDISYTYTTPHTFTNLHGTHNVKMSTQDKSGDAFIKWSDTSSTSSTRIISSGGTYQAEYGSPGPDFTLEVTPRHQRIGPGSSTTYTLNLGSKDGFDSVVSFNIAGLPFNSTATFNPTSIVPPGTVTLRIDTVPASMIGHYLLILTGFGGGKVHSVEIELSLGACVIATATYGSELSPEVNLLRHFRDDYIMHTFAGEQFMKTFNNWYYSFSPYLAEIIVKNSLLKEIAKVILYPLIFGLKISSFVYDCPSFNQELAAFVSGFITSILIGIMYLTPLLLLPAFFVRNRLVNRIFKRTAMVMSFILTSSIIAAMLAEIVRIEILMMFSSAIFVLSSVSLSAFIATYGIMDFMKLGRFGVLERIKSFLL